MVEIKLLHNTTNLNSVEKALILRLFTLQNSGCKWPIVGKAMAFKTRSGVFDGPGPSKVFSGIAKGLFKASGAATASDMMFRGDWRLNRTNKGRHEIEQTRKTDVTMDILFPNLFHDFFLVSRSPFFVGGHSGFLWESLDAIIIRILTTFELTFLQIK